MVIVLSTIAVFAPTPQLVSAGELEVHTERVVLAPRVVGRAGDAVGAASVGETAELRAALATTDRRTSPRRGARYHAIGITLPSTPSEPVLVRGRVDGVWTPWLEVPFADGEAPDAIAGAAPATEVHSEPVWMGDAEAYELDAPAGVGAVDVHLVAEGAARRTVAVRATTAGAAGAPSILARSAWGARPPRDHPATSLDLKLAVVHHSVSGNTYSSAQVPQMIRSVQAYHQDVQGWDDIAYNFVVDRFGRTWEGHAGGVRNAVVGGHSKGFNGGTTGVVVLGDYRSATPSSATLEAIARVIAWKFALHGVDPASTVPYTSGGSAKWPEGKVITLPRVVGHRDVQSTDCPGGHLYSRLGSIRKRVAQLVPEYQTGLTPTLLTLDVNGDGLIDPFQYRPGASSDVQWRATGSGTVAPTATSVFGAYRPAVGDFDGNGFDDILWHGTGSTSDSLWWHTATGHTGQGMEVLGAYVPTVGDFDGDGVDDVFWYGTGLAKDSVWYFATNRSHASAAVTQDLITGVPLVGDFDGDGRDDIFFYGPGSADDELWRSTGRGWSKTSVPVIGWYDPVVADTNADGRDDIVWISHESTKSSRWTFSGTSHASTPISTAPPAGRPYAGDFDGDGREDVLLVAPGTPADAVWYFDPVGVTIRSVSVGGSYGVATGPIDRQLLSETDDVLFVADGPDYLWTGQPTRGFLSTKVG